MRPFGSLLRNSRVCALLKLALTDLERQEITHVIVTCCTGLYAPGLDYEIIELVQLNPSVERTFIGFMGCYAAINALKAARHIVRQNRMRKSCFSRSSSAPYICRRPRNWSSCSPSQFC